MQVKVVNNKEEYILIKMTKKNMCSFTDLHASHIGIWFRLDNDLMFSQILMMTEMEGVMPVLSPAWRTCLADAVACEAMLDSLQWEVKIFWPVDCWIWNKEYFYYNMIGKIRLS